MDVKMAEKLNSNFVLKYDQYSNYINILYIHIQILKA